MFYSLGVYTGDKFFEKSKEETYRKVVFYFLIFISIFGILELLVIFKYKKTPAIFIAGVLKLRFNYLCFLVLNFPPLISCSKKEPSASPTLVKVTPVAPS